MPSAFGNRRKGNSMYFDAKEFGKRLQEQRKLAGMTQEELAGKIGLSSKDHISRIERGERTCSLDLLVMLSNVLNVSTDYLLVGKERSTEGAKESLLTIASQLAAMAEKF